MASSKHLEYFAKPENHFENKRDDKGSYFFKDLRPPAKPPSNDLTALAAKESAAGITYDKDFAQLIGKTEAGGDLYSILVANRPIKEAVESYVDLLEAKWRESKKPEDVIRLIDYYIVIDNFKEAIRVHEEAGVKHDLFNVQEWARTENGATFVPALSIWAALCSSPISRSIARAHICHLQFPDVIQVHLAGYADFISSSDALILASYILGNQHPVTLYLHKKWMNELALSPTKEEIVLPAAGSTDLNKLAASNTDLVASYRALVCLLESHVNLRFNTAETLALRQKFIEAIALGQWKTVDGIGADIAKRCPSADYLKDTLLLLSAVGQIVGVILGDATEETSITKIVRDGGSLKDVINNADLARTIFVKPFAADVEEELEEVAGAIDAIFRGLRGAIKKLQLPAEKNERVNLVAELGSGLFKILIDLESPVGAIKATFPANHAMLNFFKKDLGQQFCNKNQNARMSELLASMVSNETTHQGPAKSTLSAAPNQIKESQHESIAPDEPRVEGRAVPDAVVKAEPLKQNVAEKVPVNIASSSSEKPQSQPISESSNLISQVEPAQKVIIAEQSRKQSFTPTVRIEETLVAESPSPFGPMPGWYVDPSGNMVQIQKENAEPLIAVEKTQPDVEMKKKPIPAPLEISAPAPFAPTSAPIPFVQAKLLEDEPPKTPRTPKILGTNDFEDDDNSWKGNFGGFKSSNGPGDAGRSSGFGGPGGNRGGYQRRGGGEGAFRGNGVGRGGYDNNRGGSRGGGFSGGHGSSYY